MSARRFIRAGVVGWPISHSLSPIIHGYWLKKYNIDGEYTALAVQPEDFTEFVLSASENGLSGVNVTIPHKEAAYALCDTLDADARAAGAANVLIFNGKKVEGRNTDIGGFAAALHEDLGGDAARRGPVVVLGAGGAARAIILSLEKDGARDIRILNRTRARAEKLSKSLSASESVSVFDWGDWTSAFADAALLVNTTSLGMAGKDAFDVPLERLPPAAAVCDIVYNPLETSLMKLAKAQGRSTSGGLGMLMHQAAPAFAAWFGIAPEVTAELRAMLEAKLRG